MRGPRAIGLLCVLILGGSPALSAGYDDSPEAIETYVDLLVIEQVLKVHSETFGPDPEPPEDWITLEQFSEGMPELLVGRLPMRDGWGRAFLVGPFKDEVTVVSRGENGVADIIEGLRPRKPTAGAPPSVRELFEDDMFRRGNYITNAPRTVASRQRKTMADLRIAATATESWSIDHGRYPLQDDGFKGLESIRSELEPIYIRALTLVDAWGNPLLYWSNELHYVFVSTGADGILDPVWNAGTTVVWEIEFGNEVDHPNADIVFRDGQFVQWPKGAQQ